ncbi:sulfotransferase domain-containing protein [Lysobacter sp. A289]
MNWTLKFSDYVRAPFEAWPQDRPLQARKLQECAARQCQTRNLAVDGMISRVSRNSSQRVVSRPPTLFLVNCGSSGSHWVEAMLSALPGIHACGEVYVPPAIGGELADAEQDDRAFFLDALHQLHMEVPTEVADQDILINSAHSWNPHDLMGSSALAVVLVRDPLDVVASRTFRKPKLRRHVTPMASDEQYLEQNISMVEKFYRSALRRKPEHLVRYEDIREGPAEVLGRMATWLGRPAATSTLQGIAERYSADAQQGSGQRLSNVYQGSKAGLPQPLIDIAANRLHRLRSDLGYA